MMIPEAVALEILSYRDFYDIPRLILVTDNNANFWILDCVFIDGEDDYSTEYVVYSAGKDGRAASKAFDKHMKGEIEIQIGLVAVSDLKFDSTMRHHLTYCRKSRSD